MRKKKRSSPGRKRKRRRKPGGASSADPAQGPAENTSLFTAVLKLPDMIVLARTVRPDLRSYEADALAREFAGITARLGTEAFEERAVPALREHIRDELLRLPLAVLSEASWLMKPFRDALADTLAEAEAEVRSARGAEEVNQRPYAELFTERGELIREAQRRDRTSGKPGALDEEFVEAALAPGGAVSRALVGYEERPQQGEMVRAVATALSVGRHLMVEGGTGVGKSLAYLIPAALWARRTGRPVVVSTHTKNLQHQLFAKDLPLVSKVIAELAPAVRQAHDGRVLSPSKGAPGEDRMLEVALIKGRANYLCLRKLLHVLRMADFELTEQERISLLPVLTWGVNTETGDLSENAAFQLDAPASLLGHGSASSRHRAGSRR